jgi:flagellar hook-associated protein 2
MSLSTNMVSGLASGFDWRSMVDQLMQVESRRVDLKASAQSEQSDKLSQWQSFNAKLIALKSAAEKLKDPDDFAAFTSAMSTDSTTIDGEDLLSVTTGISAAPGSYAIKVTNLATAQKLSSNPFTSKTAELGSSYAGDIILNGKVVAINATNTLADVASSINSVNTGTDPSGVTASIVSFGANNFRLLLTNDATGADGISLLNGSSTNLTQQFGWKDQQTAVVKNSITNGAQSDGFSTASVAVQSLLGLAGGEVSTGTLTIDSTAVTINLATQSLTDIKDAINTAMAGAGKGSQIVASVVSSTTDGDTSYKLQIEGSQSFVDENNILNTLGVLHNDSADISAANTEVSGNAMTADGDNIGHDTKLVDIDGYISYDASDDITMTGTKTGGGAASSTFSITSATTVQDLLDAIETQYATNAGDVIAYVTSDGKIQVEDVAGGGSLNVILTDNITNGQLEFVDGNAAFGDATAARKREIAAGEDATVEVDGLQVTDASNTIDDVIAGVTLNLIKEEADTTVTLNVERDIKTIKSTISDFVDRYNGITTYIASQFTYDDEEQQGGGILFGDSTLRSVKSDILSVLNETVWGVDSEFASLSLVGIDTERDENGAWNLKVDDSKLTGYLKSNFNDVMALFVGQGVTSTSTLTYIDHGRDSQAGDYTVHINRAATQGTATGNVDLSAGGADETLTITQGESSASITITNGMTLSDIKNVINTELDQAYAQTIVGDQQLTEGAVAITAETNWDSITGTTLQDNDTIEYSGTDRSGNIISGSYTISDVASNTVQGLLSSIENNFSSTVTATIDTNGRLVITDKSNGNSQVSLSVTEPVDRGLDFGTIDVTSGAGDNSVTGRYAMSITASDDGSNHLVLKNDDYGSGSFTVSQDVSDNNYNHVLNTSTNNTTVSSSAAVDIVSGTTWNDMFGASAADNDTVTIAGKARNGTTDISGTYTITDITSDTVGGLLSAIESAYSAQGTTATASIRNGQIYVEDTTAGASAISLTLTANNEGGGSLSLGDFDQTTERDLDLGLINETVSGDNVAGTIGGESAIGLGQVLTGDDDNTNTDGFSVKYSGTSDDTDVGTIKLTVGIAELFERILYNMTDSVDGYVAFKQDSLQDRIQTMADQISAMESRLETKMQTMLSRFIAMELALSEIQNQSSWLTGQIQSLQGLNKS